jgi:hypothetical protein
MRKRSIDITGNDSIDQATAEIAVALRKACPVMCGDQDHYDEAMRLRDAIMTGTRALAACKCCVDNECECAGRNVGTVARNGEIVVPG